jgi:hypoxanthine-DNA glycosylase
MDSKAKKSFRAIIGSCPSVLILGSMPGELSLQEQQYYAHPRNAFWYIMQELFAIPLDFPYSRRLQMLTENNIALWDVLKSCKREGSLDASIQNASIETNDFQGLFEQYPMIELIAFNGAKAEQEFRRRVVPELAAKFQNKHMIRLPSTSPAMASLTKEQKLQKWQVIIRS